MTTKEFQVSFAIANDSAIDLTDVDNTNHFGFGLRDFAPVHTTLRAVAKTIRWQALQLNGEWEAAALDEVAKLGKKKFIILG